MSAVHAINTLHASVAHLVDPEFAKAYQYQVGHLRADQVPYEVYNADRSKFSFPTAKVTGPYPDVGSATIHNIPVNGPEGTIRLEVYIPTEEAKIQGGLAKNGRLPTVVDFHGGGFVIGGLKADESWCRQVCQAIGAIMINVEYRLAPEYPHPTPVMDGYQALQWVVKNADTLGVDTERIAVSGLSAGGCIAAVCALLARDDPAMPKLVLQMLFVPVLDARFIPEEGSAKQGSVPYESYISCEHAPMLPLARLVWFYNLWLGKGELRKTNANDIRASPIVASSHAGLAPATTHAAEIDPLCSEAEAYHQKLQEAEVKSTLRIYRGQGHVFAHWDGAVSAGHEFFKNTAAELKEAFTTCS